ncbi:hypothetical protein [Actinomadura sp. 6K520]|uniref:hypothetical protein n=1 Tax=Actinomadura sp. 6K520 TaxID=2530364 RepID=UPI001405553D|nr:hypothetical protein [Actinomadura sp. 6K520]
MDQPWTTASWMPSRAAKALKKRAFGAALAARECGETVWPNNVPGRSGATTGPSALSGAMRSSNIDALPAIG